MNGPEAYFRGWLLSKGLRNLEPHEEVLLRFHFQRERKIRLYSSIISNPNLEDATGVLRRLRAELFPEEDDQLEKFSKEAKEKFKKYQDGGFIFRVSRDSDGSLKLKEQHIKDVKDIDLVHKLNRPRRRR